MDDDWDPVPARQRPGWTLAAWSFAALGGCALLPVCCGVAFTSLLLVGPAGAAAEQTLATGVADSLTGMAWALGVGGGLALVVVAAGSALATVIRALGAGPGRRLESGARARAILDGPILYYYEDEA